MEELKKCPFCGGEAILEGTYMFDVICTKCGVRTSWYKTKEEAIEAWNRRVEE